MQETYSAYGKPQSAETDDGVIPVDDEEGYRGQDEGRPYGDEDNEEDADAVESGWLGRSIVSCKYVCHDG